MATHKALWLPKVGAEFTLGKNETPEPGHGQVLVQLEATALNPLEWKNQQSGFSMVKEYPAILGADGAGVVRKVGGGVTNLTEGDKVRLLDINTVHIKSIVALAIKIPPNVSFEQAASIATGFNPFAVATYAQQPKGLSLTPPFEEGGLGKYANQPIVIMGGASSLGQYAIQLARLSGFSPVITTASLHNKDLLVSLDRTLCRRQKGVCGHWDVFYAAEPRARCQVFGRAHQVAGGGGGQVEVLPGGLKGVVPGLKRLEANGVSATKLVVRPAETA